jgi:hypothetical protein
MTTKAQVVAQCAELGAVGGQDFNAFGLTTSTCSPTVVPIA